MKFDGPGACPPRRIAKKLQPPRHEPEKTKRRGTAAKAAVPFFSAEAHSLHKDPSRSKPAVGNMHDRQGRRRAGVLGADDPPAMESYCSRRQVSPSTTTAKQPDITVANPVIPGRCASETDSPRGFRYPRYSSIMPWEPNNAGDKNIVGTHPFESIPLPSPSAYRINPSFWEVQDLGADRPSSASERRSSSSGFFAGNQRDPQQWGSDLSLPDESRDRILEITGIQGKKETGTAETGHRRSEAGKPV